MTFNEWTALIFRDLRAAGWKRRDVTAFYSIMGGWLLAQFRGGTSAAQVADLILGQ